MEFFNKARDTLTNLRDLTLVSKKDYNATYGMNDALMNANADSPHKESRPNIPYPYLDTSDGSKIPLWRLAPNRVYEMADEIGDLRVILETIQREMFRNGPLIRPKYKYKCGQCAKEFSEKPVKKYVPLEQVGKTEQADSLECDACGNTKTFLQPKPDNRVVLQTLLTKEINHNGQKLIDVGRQFEYDLDVIDGGYAIASRKYAIGLLTTPDPLTGAKFDVDFEASEVDEIIRVHPGSVSVVANENGTLGYDNAGNPVWICPQYKHREKRLAQPYCDICGCKAFKAVLAINSLPFGLPLTDPKKSYYAEHEIIWKPGKYRPDLIYGFSPIMSIWKKAMSLFYQDEYIWKYFDKDRPPKSILAIAGRNYETAQAFMERQKTGAKVDPFMPRPILLQADNAKAAVEFIDLTPNFKELELTELRKELRQIMLTIYGVTPVYAGEQKGSGLGNEGLQVTLTNRSMKWYQRVFNDAFFAQITTKIFGIDDWEIVLEDSEEIDKLREEQIRGEQIKNAQMLYSMGFEVMTDGNGQIITSQFPNPERQMMMMGGGLGSNVAGGKTDKVAKPGIKQEKSTKFGGEPLQSRDSDEGGKAGGSPTSGFSFSDKSIDTKIKEIIQKGVLNNWTQTNMGKKLAKELNIDEEEALNMIKLAIISSIDVH